MKRRSLYFAVLLFFVSASALTGQDNAVVPEVPSDEFDRIAREYDVVDTPAVEEEKKSAENKTAKETNAARNVPQNDSVSSGLLSITEGNFKYSRIPDIVLAQPKPLTDDGIVQVSSKPLTVDSNTKEKEEGESSAGLLGMSKKTADTAIIIFTVLLIIGIVILYKSRSGRSRQKVFSAHPRK